VATRKGFVLGVRLYLGRQATHVMMDRHKKTRNQEVKKMITMVASGCVIGR
jgi:hypothetical protein